MSLKVPEFKEPGLTDFLVRMMEERDRVRENLLSRITANKSVLLQSPGNKIYEVTVDDAGAISAVLVAG